MLEKLLSWENSITHAKTKNLSFFTRKGAVATYNFSKT
jgi:hypothetical protein